MTEGLQPEDNAISIFPSVTHYQITPAIGTQTFDNSVFVILDSIQTLWTGFGGVCLNNSRGDPVVVYDQLADRWVVSQFAGTPVPTDECVAVSQTSDATGAWNRYDFSLGTNFFDYPKLSVWPDAYYMSMNVFNTAGTVVSNDRLLITPVVVPEPTSLALCGVALAGGLFKFRRRRTVA